MKKINTYKLVVGFIITIALILPGAAIAKSHVTTIEGTIEGALCVLKAEKCPPDDLDAHLLIENNFVLIPMKESIWNNLGNSVDANGLFIAFLFYILSVTFREGVKLQEETDLTV